MKSKVKPIVTRSAADLARALNLSSADGVELEVRSQINEKIIQGMDQSGLTHTQLARTAGTSRSRLTAILNRNRQNVSTDLMLRILAALGYRTKVSFQRIKSAA